MGLTSYETLKVKRRIGKWKVIILVDFGTAHNFISLEMVKELGV